MSEMKMSELKLEWEDEVTLGFDGTINMGIGFDWETLERTKQQATTCRGDFIVFASGCNREWSVYGGDLGYLLFQEFQSMSEAVGWVQDYHNECLVEIKNNKHDKHLVRIAELELKNASLLQELCAIQSACVGEIAMGHRLDAQSIGESITQATGLTHPELTKLLEQSK